MKETLFVDINDGTSSKNIQVLLSKENKPNLGYGTSIEASGVTSLSPRGQIELKADKVKVIGMANMISFNLGPRLYYIFF